MFVLLLHHLMASGQIQAMDGALAKAMVGCVQFWWWRCPWMSFCIFKISHWSPYCLVCLSTSACFHVVSFWQLPLQCSLSLPMISFVSSFSHWCQHGYLYMVNLLVWAVVGEPRVLSLSCYAMGDGDGFIPSHWLVFDGWSKTWLRYGDGVFGIGQKPCTTSLCAMTMKILALLSSLEASCEDLVL
jgi:hypothetical protein